MFLANRQSPWVTTVSRGHGEEAGDGLLAVQMRDTAYFLRDQSGEYGMNRGKQNMIREQVLQKITEVPALPTAATQVLQAIQDPDVDITKLVRIIELDQSLTSNLLKLVNSALFSAGRKIGSVKEAVTRLGLRQISRLVVASAIAPMTNIEIVGYDLEPGLLWRHSIRVAFAVNHLSDILSFPHDDEAFTAGILHDIGKIILGTFLQINAQKIIEHAYGEIISFDQAERELLGIDHAETGAALLRHWQIPESIVKPVAEHHHPPTENGSRLCDLIHVADGYCLLSGDGFGLDGLHYRIDPHAINRLGIRERDIELLLTRLDDVEDEINLIMSS
ncbi:MAG: HDOD domain-containing protein [Lentisphaerae bacterium]|nr:MAG: HDOD domain-containing protein [Lentisphaerota bacterium]